MVLLSMHYSFYFVAVWDSELIYRIILPEIFYTVILTLIVYRVFHYINYHFMKNPSMKESESIWVLK